MHEPEKVHKMGPWRQKKRSKLNQRNHFFYITVFSLAKTWCLYDQQCNWSQHRLIYLSKFRTKVISWYFPVGAHLGQSLQITYLPLWASTWKQRREQTAFFFFQACSLQTQSAVTQVISGGRLHPGLSGATKGFIQAFSKCAVELPETCKKTIMCKINSFLISGVVQRLIIWRYYPDDVSGTDLMLTPGI